MSYVITFLAVALFPTALAAIGGHLATVAIADKQRRGWWLRAVWALAFIGVSLAALQQIEAYRSDSEHDTKISNLQNSTDGLHETLSTSLQRQEYMRGQLDSISVMVGKVGEKSTDPVVGQLAGALAKMADSAKPLSQNGIKQVQILYKGASLSSGTSIKSENSDPKVIKLSNFQIKNVGTTLTSLSLRWYFAVPIVSVSGWLSTPSDDAASFPVLLWEGAQIPPSPQEIWNGSDFAAAFQDEPKYPVTSKLKVFYGADKPLELVLSIIR